MLTCPQSVKEWREAASRFNCQSIANNCSTFEYHCVMTHDTSKFVEVCAPNEIIIGNFYLLIVLLFVRIWGKNHIVYCLTLFLATFAIHWRSTGRGELFSQ